MSKTKRNQKSTTPAPAPAPAPVVEIQAPAPQAPVVQAPVGEVIGEANLTSKRIAPGTALTQWRVVPNQRKDVQAKYYVQGGTIRRDVVSGREMFLVAVEIPHTDLYAAKVQMVALRAELAAGQKSA